jgi:hypothetical protein
MDDSDDESVAPSVPEPAPSGADTSRSGRPSIQPGQIFAVNKPPSKRCAPPAISGSAAPAKNRRRPNGAAPNPAAAATPAANSAIEAPSGAASSDLLDDRVVVDPDENYSENERALTHFIRLHPMLR